MWKLLLGVFLIFFLSETSKGQQDPVFSQYQSTMQIFNPAYSGNWESMNFKIIARNQWLGFENRPQTQAFLFEAPMRNGQVAVGFDVLNDNIGLESKLTFAGNYSYMVKLRHGSNLTFGLKASVTNYSNNLNDYALYETGDPKFLGEIESKTVPNFGIGVFYGQPDFFVGFSVPKLIETQFKNSENFSVSGTEKCHYYLTGTYTFNISKWFAFRPSFLAKATAGAPPQFDVSANFLLANQFLLGGSFRTNDSFGFTCQWIIGRKLRLGYATDFTITKLRNYINGTHEVLLSVEVSSVKEDFVSPRNF